MSKLSWMTRHILHLATVTCPAMTDSIRKIKRNLLQVPDIKTRKSFSQNFSCGWQSVKRDTVIHSLFQAGATSTEMFIGRSEFFPV